MGSKSSRGSYCDKTTGTMKKRSSGCFGSHLMMVVEHRTNEEVKQLVTTDGKVIEKISFAEKKTPYIIGVQRPNQMRRMIRGEVVRRETLRHIIEQNNKNRQAKVKKSFFLGKTVRGLFHRKKGE